MANLSINFGTECGTITAPAVITTGTAASVMSGAFFPDTSGALIVSGYDSGYYNKTTKKWEKAADYIRDKLSNNTKPLIIQTPTGLREDVANVMNVREQEEKDDSLIALIRKEYCFLQVRYKAYLSAFLNSIKIENPVNGAMKDVYLEILIDLNHKLNALVLLIDYIKETRAAYVNANTSTFNELNTRLSEEMASLQPSTELITSNQAVLNTRKEMIRYTKEKNNAISNQISLWASLNIVAIAMIFHLYRSM
jgi:hypothetical protein